MQPEPDPQRSVGRTFRFVACLGRGGFGEVYRATMTDRGGVRTDVAVKVLHDEVDADGQSVRRLRDEAHVLSALRHPAILKVHDLVSLDGRVALVTEFVDGEDLSALLRADAPMPVRALLDAVGQVASALAAAWETAGPEGRPLGLVHRDVKPHNVRIGRHGDVKLLDFGIARGTGIERSARTDTDAVVGSWQYMAPEAFEGRAGPEADVFSLGCVLFEGLAGERPYHGLELRDLYALAVRPDALASAIGERVAAMPAGVPAEVRSLCLAMLGPLPLLRPTAAAVARKCEELVDRLGGPSLRRWCRERAWAAPAERRGEFDGREITEGDDARSAGRAAAPRAAEGTLSADTLSRSGMRAAAISSAVGLGFGTLLLGVLLALVVLVATWRWARSPSPPEPTPAPVLAEPTPAPSPSPPEGVEPPPPEEPEPTPDPPAAWVGVDDKTRVPVRLVDRGRVVRLPASVAISGPTATWMVEADFGQGFVPVGSVVLVAGERREVWCKTLLRTCEVR